MLPESEGIAISMKVLSFEEGSLSLNLSIEMKFQEIETFLDCYQ